MTGSMDGYLRTVANDDIVLYTIIEIIGNVTYCIRHVVGNVRIEIPVLIRV